MYDPLRHNFGKNLEVNSLKSICCRYKQQHQKINFKQFATCVAYQANQCIKELSFSLSMSPKKMGPVLHQCPQLQFQQTAFSMEFYPCRKMFF